MGRSRNESELVCEWKCCGLHSVNLKHAEPNNGAEISCKPGSGSWWEPSSNSCNKNKTHNNEPQTLQLLWPLCLTLSSTRSELVYRAADGLGVRVNPILWASLQVDAEVLYRTAVPNKVATRIKGKRAGISGRSLLGDDVTPPLPVSCVGLVTSGRRLGRRLNK